MEGGRPAALTWPRLLAAVAFGGYLAVTPFLRYSSYGHSSIPHGNHAARHGGQLAMIGDHHVELRRADGRVEAFVSDAWRRPVRPRSGRVRFDGGRRAPMQWDSYRMTAADVAASSAVAVTIELNDGTELTADFDFTSLAND
ncbi:MAG TPA: hypothetical protein VEC57_11555 [Candidatus Limnocylindrales bacterium]|nr:hypothetical protein [Candidatus Limnocylindrales bacterium]